jgi:hypothetical protein
MVKFISGFDVMGELIDGNGPVSNIFILAYLVLQKLLMYATLSFALMEKNAPNSSSASPLSKPFAAAHEAQTNAICINSPLSSASETFCQQNFQQCK